MFSDFKFALRSLLKAPSFAVVALVTFALGIGVNTAMFGVIRVFLLQPAPYPSAEQLVRVFRTSPQSRSWPHSAADLADIRAQNHVYSSVTEFQWWTFSLSEPGQPAERLRGVLASADIFATLGVQPALGRGFTAEEQLTRRNHVVVITDNFWHSRFGGDPKIIGRTLRIDGTNSTLIGVMPPSFAYPLFWGRLDAMLPMVLSADWQQSRGNHWLNAIARLKAGESVAHAQAEMDTITARLTKQYPDTNAGNGLRLVPLHESAMDDTAREISWLTFGLAGFVLLIACANLANLQLAHSTSRARDFAVRAALGASRLQLMRQLFVESLTLAVAGGAFGVLIAGWINDLLSRSIDVADGIRTSIQIDWWILGFAIVASCLAGLISGAVPAWFSSRVDLNSALKQQSRGSTGDRSRHRLRHALIVAELAFALVLLAGAVFFIRGLQRFTARDPGWQTNSLLAGTVTLPDTLPTDRYVNEQARRTFYEHLLQRIQTLPGVEHASLSSSLPIYSYNSSRNIAIEGRPDPAPGQEPLADHVMITADFFATIGLQFVVGHTFPASVRADGPRFAVINEAMAKHFWPNETAIGKRIGSSDPKQREWVEIIGVVRDVRFVGNIGLPDTPFQVYRPLIQEPWGYLTIALRSKNSEALIQPVRRALTEIDPDLPIVDLRTIDQSIDHAQHNMRIVNQLLAGFASLGLVLAAIGLYGVISTLVVQRTSEFGIRFALGAQTRDVLWLVLNKGTQLIALGSAIGLVGAAALLYALGHLVPGLPGSEPLAIAVVVVLLIGVALGACLIPARRAARVDPIVALRAE